MLILCEGYCWSRTCWNLSEARKIGCVNMKSSRRVSAKKEGEPITFKAHVTRAVRFGNWSFTPRPFQVKISSIMRRTYTCISSLLDLLNWSWSHTSRRELKLYFTFSTVTMFLFLFIHGTKDAFAFLWNSCWLYQLEKLRQLSLVLEDLEQDLIDLTNMQLEMDLNLAEQSLCNASQVHTPCKWVQMCVIVALAKVSKVSALQRSELML